MSDLPPLSSLQNARGNTLFFDADDPRGRALEKAGGDLNPLALRLWDLAVGSQDHWDVVVDVGANYGEMISGVDLSTADRVVAFEPSPRTAASLRRTAAGLPTRVELVEKAVGSSVGSVTLEIDNAWSGKTHVRQATLAAPRSVTEVEVEITTLDSFFADQDIDRLCVKIDVEGLEPAVLDGARSLLATAGRAAVVLEILHMPVQDLWTLSRRHPLYLLVADGSGLVRWAGGDAEELGRLLHDGSLHRENALLLAGTDVLAFDAELAAGSRVHRPVVYTALLGDYEPLREQPVALSTTVPFICFTDDPELVSDTWEIRLVEPRFPDDPVRSSRHLKIAGDPSLRGFTETIWIDNRVDLLLDPVEVVEQTLADHDLAVFEHSFRDDLTGEFEAVASGGYDDSTRVYEQFNHYAQSHPSVLDEKPLWTGVLVRRNTPEVRRAMSLWSDHVNRYSRRDQLSLPVILETEPIRVNRLTGDNRLSSWHAWPEIQRSARASRADKGSYFRNAARAPIMRLREIEGPMREELTRLRAEAESADVRLQAVRAERDAVKGQRDEARAQRDAAKSQGAAAREQRDEAKDQRDVARVQRDEAREQRDAAREQTSALRSEIEALREALRQGRDELEELRAAEGVQRRRAGRAEEQLRATTTELRAHLESRGHKAVVRLRSVLRRSR